MMRYVDDPNINPYDLPTPYFILNNTSVLAAVAYQNLDVVQYALKLSDHHHEQSFNLENTPLHIAASLPRVDITKCIVLYYPDLNSRNIYLETPLFYAAKNNQIKQVRFLLELGANFRAKDFEDKTLLHVICYQEREINVKMLEILLDAGCDPNAPDNLGRTPLHVIAENQQTPHALDFAKLLIQRGGDVNVQNDYGDTVLHTVVDYCEDYNQFFDLLWDSGADIRKKNNNDFSYLDEILLCGCSPRRQKILKNLLIVDFSGKFRIGFNPISYMKEDHQLEIDCREELQRLKSRKIEKFETEPEYSFIRFFFLNEIQISKLCSNPKLRTSIAKFNEKEYKHYGSRLKTILTLGLRIFYENEDGHKFFSILSGGQFNFYIISDIMKIIPLRRRYKFRKFLDPQTEPQTIKKMMQREELKNKKSIKYKIEKRQIVFNPNR